MAKNMGELPFQSKRPLPSLFDDPEHADIRVYTISELNGMVRELLEGSFPAIWVEGEISNFRKYPSGHLYFTLKDAGAELPAVMFQGRAATLAFTPEDGQQVLALGTVTVYEVKGKYQLSVHEMRPAGLGKLQLAFEQLKEKLQREGLFDPAHKRPVPAFPQRLGVITSAQGAVIQDILNILSRRYPALEILLFPVKVQGEGAAQEIAQAIKAANRFSRAVEKIDTLIVGRGGGSLEDLWAFNEEIVARAIYASEVPVISAVGHEIDFTIADFVADLRAPTPSAAAELAVPLRDDLLAQIRQMMRQLVRAQRSHLEAQSSRLQTLQQSYALRRPLRQLSDSQQMLDGLSARLARAFRVAWQRQRERLHTLMARLEAANPATVLRRGFSIVENAVGQTISAADRVKPGDRVRVRLHRGALNCEVKTVETEGGHDGRS